MSYIDEICGYLLGRGYITREEVSKLMKGLGESSSALFEDDDNYGDDDWIEQEEEPSDVQEEEASAEGRRKGKSKGKPHNFGGRRGNDGKCVEITAPELDAKIPTLDWGLKLMQFLAFLQWLGGTGKMESEWSWEAFVKEVDKFYELGQDGLARALKGKKKIEKFGKNQIALLILYSHGQGLMPPDALDGYMGPVVAAFNSEMGDFLATEWTVNKHAWIYRHPNIGTMKRAVIVYNRLRHVLVDSLKDFMSNLYLVVNLTTWNIRHSATPPDLNDDTCRTTELWLRKIPRGSFAMGSPWNEKGRDGNEKRHHVMLTQDFYIGMFECTQRQWELVMGDNPSTYKGDCRPVENVSYDMIRGKEAGAGWPAFGHAVDSSSFMGRLQEKTGLVFDLPTEAQWEYACRAGTTTALNSGKDLVSTELDTNMNEVGRYVYNRDDGNGGFTEHTKVGSYMPNGWGLYDMHGNVKEWCLDWYVYGYEQRPPRRLRKTAMMTNPTGPSTGSWRVIRNGCWHLEAARCRSAERYRIVPSENYDDIGFRIALIPVQGRYPSSLS
ncbi:MAG: formylglycine-generating enzyme family protein [Lentisphaeria bacterium]|nr:formylglycine-generating enzyme family protein [Lentisphaeria bacterium]